MLSAHLALTLHCKNLLVTCVVRLPAADERSEAGTTDYMAPEHLAWYLDDRPDAIKGPPTHHQGRADVYSLGICLWWLLVGKDPVLRVLSDQGQTPSDEELQFAKLELKQQLVSLTSASVACICFAVPFRCSSIHPFIQVMRSGEPARINNLEVCNKMFYSPAVKS